MDRLIMETNKILFFLMLFIFTANALFAGIVGLKSHSDIWYFLEEYDKKHGTYWRYWFPISTMIYSTLLVLFGIQFSEWALCGLTLYYVAFAPQFETIGAPKTSHFFGAGVAVVGSQIMLLSLGYWKLSVEFALLTILSLLLLNDKKKITYWLENWAFLSIAIAYFLKIYINQN